jgi:hypothetical protein
MTELSKVELGRCDVVGLSVSHMGDVRKELQDVTAEPDVMPNQPRCLTSPPEACATTRQKVAEAALFSSSVDVSPQFAGINCDTRRELACRKLNDALNAFQNKPSDCEMVNNTQPNLLTCDRCDFEEILFPYQ